MQPFRIQLLDVTLMQLTNWRWSWRGVLITSVIAPVVTTVSLGIFAQSSGPAVLGHVMTGNIVLSLLFGTVGTVSSNFAYMRATGILDYFATLPVYRTTLILASVLAFLALSLPPALLTLILGSLILQVPVVVSPLIVVVLPLISMALCGLGALIGLLGRAPEEVNSVSTLATFALVAIGPVIIPAERLPGIIQAIGLFSPATYAASALRQVVLAQADRLSLGLDLVVLCGVMLVLLWLVGQRLDWRQK